MVILSAESVTKNGVKTPFLVIHFFISLITTKGVFSSFSVSHIIMCIQSQMDNMTECICGYNVGVHMARHKRTCKVIRVTHKLCSEIEELREENIALKARLEEARGAKPM